MDDIVCIRIISNVSFSFSFFPFSIFKIIAIIIIYNNFIALEKKNIRIEMDNNEIIVVFRLEEE